MHPNRFGFKLVVVALTCLPAVPAISQEESVSNPKQLAASYGRLPISFEANQGQTDSRVKFLSRGQGYSLFLTQREAVLALKRQDKSVSPGANSASMALAKRSAEPESEA